MQPGAVRAAASKGQTTLEERHGVNEGVRASGLLVFLPWVRLPRSVIVEGFRFVPVKISNLASVIGPEIAETAGQAMTTHVDQGVNR